MSKPGAITIVPCDVHTPNFVLLKHGHSESDPQVAEVGQATGSTTRVHVRHSERRKSIGCLDCKIVCA